MREAGKYLSPIILYSDIKIWLRISKKFSYGLLLHNKRPEDNDVCFCGTLYCHCLFAIVKLTHYLVEFNPLPVMSLMLL